MLTSLWWGISNPMHMTSLSIVGRGVHVYTPVSWHWYQLAVVVVMYSGKVWMMASWQVVLASS